MGLLKYKGLHACLSSRAVDSYLSNPETYALLEPSFFFQWTLNPLESNVNILHVFVIFTLKFEFFNIQVLKQKSSTSFELNSMLMCFFHGFSCRSKWRFAMVHWPIRFYQVQPSFFISFQKRFWNREKIAPSSYKNSHSTGWGFKLQENKMSSLIKAWISITKSNHINDYINIFWNIFL